MPTSIPASTVRNSPSRFVDLVTGAVYLLLGVLGLGLGIASSGDATDAKLFGLLPLNPVLGLLHAVLGGVLLFCSFRGERPAGLAASLGGVAMLALGIAGLFLTASNANVLALNGSANLLHFATATLLLAVGLGFRRDSTPE